MCVYFFFFFFFFFFQAEDGIRDWSVTGVQTCALPISSSRQTYGLLDTRSEGPPQAVRQHVGDANGDDVADGHAGRRLEIDDAVAAGAAAELLAVLLRAAIDQDVDRLPSEPCATSGGRPASDG